MLSLYFTYSLAFVLTANWGIHFFIFIMLRHTIHLFDQVITHIWREYFVSPAYFVSSDCFTFSLFIINSSLNTLNIGVLHLRLLHVIEVLQNCKDKLWSSKPHTLFCRHKVSIAQDTKSFEECSWWWGEYQTIKY